MRKASSSAAENESAIVLAQHQYMFWRYGQIPPTRWDACLVSNLHPNPHPPSRQNWGWRSVGTRYRSDLVMRITLRSKVRVGDNDPAAIGDLRKSCDGEMP